MMLLIVAAGFGVMFLAHVAPFPFLLDAVAPAPSLWHVAPTDGPPTVYLTFDDGPNPTATPDLLDVLSSEQALATFFLVDQHVTTETAPIIRRMFAAGHGVGLHASTRKLMLMTPDELASYLTEAADRIEHLAGSRPCRSSGRTPDGAAVRCTPASRRLTTRWWGGDGDCGILTGTVPRPPRVSPLASATASRPVTSS